MSEAPVKPSRRRRRFQFSLRTLLIVVTIGCVALGALQWNVRRVPHGEVVGLLYHRGYAGYSYNSRREPTGSPKLDERAEPSGPRWLRHFVGDDFFTSIEFIWLSDADDALLAQIRDQQSVRYMRFWTNNYVTDEGLKCLGEMKNLEYLSNPIGEHVTDAGVKHLKGLTNLQFLNVCLSCRLSDVGLEHLKGLTNLRVLQLPMEPASQVTDAGLESLKGLTNLQVLWLPRRGITRSAVDDLQRALPNCKIRQ